MEKEVVESTTEIVEVGKENNLALTEAQKLGLTEVNFDLFEEDKKKRLTTFNMENEEEADIVLNTLQEQAEHKINDEINKEITVVNFIVSAIPETNTNLETGEVITRIKHTLVLFDDKGERHATGSNSCYMSFAQIFKLKGKPTKEKPLIVIPIKTPAKQEGHTYLKLKVKSTNK